MWLIYRNVHMQLKVKGMQLKVSMQKNIGERGSTRAIYVHSLFSSFFLLSSSFSWGEKQSLILVMKKLLSCKRSLILVSRKLLTFGENPSLQRGISHTHILSYPLYHDSYNIKESSIWKPEWFVSLICLMYKSCLCYTSEHWILVVQNPIGSASRSAHSGGTRNPM